MTTEIEEMEFTISELVSALKIARGVMIDYFDGDQSDELDAVELALKGFW